MAGARPPVVVMILVALNAPAIGALSVLGTGKYNVQVMDDRWCAGLDQIAGACNGCMSEQWTIPFDPWLDDDSGECNTINIYSPARAWSYESSDGWVKFGLFLSGSEQLRTAVDYCELDYNNPDHERFGDNCDGEFVVIPGGFIPGTALEIGAVLPPRVDPQIGPPSGDEVYPFVPDFALLQSIVSEMAGGDGYDHLTPWGKVFVASFREWDEVGGEQPLWNMAHSLVCWQSCEAGWECGRSVIDVMPADYPTWPYDWTAQPTYLFLLYDAMEPYLDVTVGVDMESWSEIKAMFR